MRMDCTDIPRTDMQFAVQMGGDRELLFRLLCSPHGLAILAAGHSAHVNTTNLRLALMDRWVVLGLEHLMKHSSKAAKTHRLYNFASCNLLLLPLLVAASWCHQNVGVRAKRPVPVLVSSISECSSS